MEKHLSKQKQSGHFRITKAHHNRNRGSSVMPLWDHTQIMPLCGAILQLSYNFQTQWELNPKQYFNNFIYEMSHSQFK